MYRSFALTLHRNTIYGTSDFRKASKPHIWLHSANSVSATRKTCWTIPFARNSKFVGREAQLHRLESLLFAEGQPSKTAIIGLGGVGKTQVILELVYRARESYPDCSILWVPAINTESLQQAYLEAGQQLSISGIKKERADVKKLVQDHLSQENAGRWLLIFDNADDIDM